MKLAFALTMAFLFAGSGLCRGQASGNIAYGQAGGKAKAQQDERNKRTITQHELPPTRNSMFVEANVMMNVKADEHVAIFAVAREGETVDDCGRKMDATLKKFTEELKPLKVGSDDLFVDFVAQNKIYGYEVTGDIAREKLVGFDLKKNVSIHYSDQALLDKLVAAAARAEVFDLVKVDYIIKNTDSIHDRLAREAARVVKRKRARYEDVLGIKLQPTAQVYAEKSAAHYPTALYDSYVAQDSQEIGTAYYQQKYTVQSARKGRTTFYNGLDSDGFDAVIDPVILEPVVQFTFYLKLRYEIEPEKAK